MEWFEALILGLLQGLTEYLPVSSSGHLAIGSALFGIQGCLLYTSPSPRDAHESRMPSSA